MSKRAQRRKVKSHRITDEAQAMLRALAAAEMRGTGAQLEVIIRRAHARMLKARTN